MTGGIDEGSTSSQTAGNCTSQSLDALSSHAALGSIELNLLPEEAGDIDKPCL
jgi:hypothetical protein